MFEVPRKFRIFRDTEDTSHNIMIGLLGFLAPPFNTQPALSNKIHSIRLEKMFPKLGGGFKYFLFSPKFWGNDPI